MRSLLCAILLAACTSDKEPVETGAPLDTDTGEAITDADQDGSPAEEDCDDGDASVRPGNQETPYDGVDNDCDPSTPDDDLDGDGYASAEDCDDYDAQISPDATELCDGVDNNCDTFADEDTAADAVTVYTDADGDGYGDAASTYTGCAPPEGSTTDDTDCDDADATVNPGVACDYVVTLAAPGASELTLLAETDTTVSIAGVGETSLIGGQPATVALVAGTWTARADQPFLAVLSTSALGGDMVSKARGLDGAYLSSELYGTGWEYAWAINPGESDATITADAWDEETASWVSLGTQVAASGEAATFEVELGQRIFRLSADVPVLGWGAFIANPDTHVEYLVGAEGGFLDDTRHWLIPESIGKAALTGLCIDDAGCTLDLLLGEESIQSGTYTLGQGFTQLVNRENVYTISTTGAMLVRDESTPYGFDADDGSSLDGDLVPGTSGGAYDTTFVVAATVGVRNVFLERYSDLTAMIYRDGTELTVEQLVDGAWVASSTASGSAGEAVVVGDGLIPGSVWRVTASQPIHLQQHQGTSEYSWTIFSDHFAD